MQVMKSDLDVLVVESHRGAAAEATTALEAAGHHVHHCFDADDEGLTCRAVRDRGSCPLDDGMDVALLVRDPHADDRPTAREIGISCAVRAHVPVAAQGRALAAFTPFLTRRVDGDLPVDVVDTAEQGYELLRRAILQRIRTVLPCTSTAIVDCELERAGHRLIVHLRGPAVGNRAEKAAAVRVLDAVWASGRTYGQVDVSYHAADLASGSASASRGGA
jgi:hypothetical protein